LTFALGEDDSFATLLEQDQITQAAAMVLQSALMVEGAIFLIINLAVVIVGVFAALLCHDPHPDFERLDRALKAARKDLAFNKKILGEALGKAQRRFAATEREEDKHRNSSPRQLPNFSE
jgi:hypothetical protein